MGDVRGVVVELAAHRSGRRTVFSEVPLELLVCPNGEPGPALDAGKEAGVVQHQPPESREGDAFGLAKSLRLVQQLAAKRGVVVNAHALSHNGFSRYAASGFSLNADQEGIRHASGMAKGTFQTRLDEAIRERGTSRRAVAIEAKLNPNYFSDLFGDNPTRSPRDASACAIARVLGVRLDWLMEGRGDRDESGIPANYHRLPPGSRRLVDDLIEQLAPPDLDSTG